MIVQISAAVSADGYLDDNTPQRLVLSHPSDWEAVRRLRARFDAILVGAETVRRDNPALVTRDETLRSERLQRGQAPDPVKATVSRSGNLDPRSRFFTEGEGEKIVFVANDTPREKTDQLERVATVIRAGDTITAQRIAELLEKRGIGSLLVEGGSHILTLFLSEGVADYLRLAVAPFFVGDPSAPRLVGNGPFPFDGQRRMEVLSVAQAGDMSVTEYALNRQAADLARLEQTIELAARCPRSDTAYSVGAVIVTRDGRSFTGYSRETAPNNHAEEEAVLKAVAAGAPLEEATIYSSMEPCSDRKSKPLSCSALIIRHRMARVVFAAHEPDHFVRCSGERLLRDAGIEVSVVGSLAADALRVNGHIPGIIPA